MKDLLLPQGLLLLFLAPQIINAGMIEPPNPDTKKFLVGLVAQTGSDDSVVINAEEKWDGRLYDTLDEMANVYRSVGYPQDAIDKSVGQLRLVANNKDNPSWKTHVGALIANGMGGTPAIIAELEKTGPDKMPTDLPSAREAFRKAGVPESHIEGIARVVSWLAHIK